MKNGEHFDALMRDIAAEQDAQLEALDMPADWIEPVLPIWSFGVDSRAPPKLPDRGRPPAPQPT